MRGAAECGTCIPLQIRQIPQNRSHISVALSKSTPVSVIDNGTPNPHKIFPSCHLDLYISFEIQ